MFLCSTSLAPMPFPLVTSSSCRRRHVIPLPRRRPSSVSINPSIVVHIHIHRCPPSLSIVVHYPHPSLSTILSIVAYSSPSIVIQHAVHPCSSSSIMPDPSVVVHRARPTSSSIIPVCYDHCPCFVPSYADSMRLLLDCNSLAPSHHHCTSQPFTSSLKRNAADFFVPGPPPPKVVRFRLGPALKRVRTFKKYPIGK